MWAQLTDVYYYYNIIIVMLLLQYSILLLEFERGNRKCSIIWRKKGFIMFRSVQSESKYENKQIN